MIFAFFAFVLSRKQCSECKFTGKIIEESILAKIDEIAAKENVTSKCEKLPLIIKNQCNAFVKHNFEKLYAEISNGGAANQTCAKLNFCKTAEEEEADINLNAKDGEWEEAKPSWAVTWSEDL